MGYSPLSKDVILIIEDVSWWTQNDQEIVSWMDDHLPRGRNHQQGIVLTFDNEQQRNWFMLRWM